MSYRWSPEKGWEFDWGVLWKEVMIHTREKELILKMIL
jgi:hypothetical protein